MRGHGWIVCSAILATVAAGCGKSDSSAPAGESAASGGAQASAPADGPAAAVAEFLGAVRSGDDAKTASMLTKLARQKTAELNMVVAPPGSDTAQFEVGQVEYRGEDGARVQSVWSDLDENSQRRTDKLIWLLRRESRRAFSSYG